MNTNNRLWIRIAGPAGMGMNSLMDIVSFAFSSLGYNIITDSEYQSIIKGGLNFYDVNICSDIPFLSKKVDILLALDAKNLIANLSSLWNDAIIIASTKTIESVEKNIPEIRQKWTVIEQQLSEKYENTYLLWMLIGFLGLKNEMFESSIRKMFLKKWDEIVQKNIDALRNSIEIGKIFHKNLLPENVHSEKKDIIYGNRALAFGAIASELEFYSAYPMTPASTILTEIVHSKKVKFLQAEDEIAVINAALGASFTGVRSMVWTSGGGFALMTEALSFAAQAEIPIVVVLSQRSGPSTGMPTFHEQGEILYATRPTFGDIQNIVMAPSSMEQWYFFGGYSLNLAQKYQTTVVLLTDKQFSEWKVTHQNLIAAIPDRGKLVDIPDDNFARYQITEDGISPYVRVWVQNGDFIATSYEHDEYGETTENSEMKIKMTQKRNKKIQYLFENEKIFGYEVFNANAKKKIITLSFIAYTAKKYIQENPDWGLIVVTFLSPIDTRLRSEIEKCERVVFFENNFSWQLQTLLTEKLWLSFLKNTKIESSRKYDWYPFYIEDFYKIEQL